MSKKVKPTINRELVVNDIAGYYEDDIRRYGYFAIANVTDSERDEYATAPRRVNDCWCLSHIFSGNGRGYLAGKGDFKLTPGCAVLIAPGTPNITANDGSVDYREDYITFGGDTFDRMRDRGLIESGCFWLGTHRRLPAIAELMRDSSPEMRWRAGTELQNLLLNMVCRRQEQQDSLVDKLMQVIKQEPRKWWSMEEMAAFCKLSPAQTRRIFLKRTGLTPKPYSEGIKIRSAAEALANGDRRIDDIAVEYGYRDRFHFTRRFTAVMGVSPAKYREQISRK